MIKKNRLEIIFSAVSPWLILALIYFLSPDMILPLLKDSNSWIIFAGLLVWEGIGIYLLRYVLKEHDPQGRFKTTLIMAIFFFPVVLIVILGSVYHQVRGAFTAL